QVVGTAPQQVRLLDVDQSAKPRSPPASGLADVGEGPFHPLTAPPVQPTSPFSPHPPPIGPEGILHFDGLVPPHSPGLFAFRNIGSDPEVCAFGQQPVA